MYASSTSSPSTSSSSSYHLMLNYLPLPSTISGPPLGDAARAQQEHARFTFPTILILVISVILFFVFMYFYLSPIIRDPSIVAPNSTKRLQLVRTRDTVEVGWHKCRGSPQSQLGDLEKAIPVSSPPSPDLPTRNHTRKRGLFNRLFSRPPAPNDTHTQHTHTHTHTHSNSRGFSLFSPSPSSADTFPTQLSLQLPSPAYFPNPAAAEYTNEIEYRLPSPPQTPRKQYHDPTSRQSLYYTKRPISPPSSPTPKSPTPSPLSKVLCKQESSSTINSLAQQFICGGGGGTSTSAGTRTSTSTSGSTGSGSTLTFLNTPPKSDSGLGEGEGEGEGEGGRKVSPAPSVHSMLCR